MNKRYIRQIMLIIFTVLIISSNVYAGNRHLLHQVPELSNSLVTVGDVLHIGEDQIIAANGTRIDIYVDGQVVSSITDLTSNVTALITGDLTGNFRSELIIGTENSVVYIYQYQEGLWKRIDEHRYFWAPISRLLVNDITGNGWGDLVVMNSRGELFVLLSFQGELDIFWRSQTGNNVKMVELADLNGDGAAEIVLAHQSNQISVLSWHDSQLELMWENYPWGSVEGLMVGKINANQRYPEIMVTTSQGMFYSWQWSGVDYTITRRFAQTLEGKSLYLESIGLINFSKDQGLNLYRVNSDSLTKQWEVIGLKLVEIYQVNGRKLVKDSNSDYYWLDDFDINRVTVLLDGKLQNVTPEIIYIGGQTYLPLKETAEFLGWEVLGNRRLFITKNLDYIIIEPNNSGIIWNNLPVPVSVNMIRHGSRIYLSTDFFKILGYNVNFNPLTFELVYTPIRRIWF